jgi:hypothetical protein
MVSVVFELHQHSVLLNKFLLSYVFVIHIGINVFHQNGMHASCLFFFFTFQSSQFGKPALLFLRLVKLKFLLKSHELFDRRLDLLHGLLLDVQDLLFDDVHMHYHTCLSTVVPVVKNFVVVTAQYCDLV